jgi:hypothetical protein
LLYNPKTKRAIAIAITILQWWQQSDKSKVIFCSPYLKDKRCEVAVDLTASL